MKTSMNSTTAPKKKLAVFGLASCFGCQLQITNMEPHLLEVLDQVELSYWQLTSSQPKPNDYDIAVIEGAVTTQEAQELVKEIRQTASVVIAIGACAVTGGIPGLAAPRFDERVEEVYSSTCPQACGSLQAPVPVSAIVPVDFEVRCCPIDPRDFVSVLERVLQGSNRSISTATLCGECKRNERGCFWGRGIMCLGLVTRSGCSARCPSLGRPCNGCAGLSKDANTASAKVIATEWGIDPARFEEALEMFNQQSMEDNCG